MLKNDHPTYLRVANEGASLHVWHQGTGPLLILIQGGGGDGARFNAAIPSLGKHYTTVAFDRRGNAGSTSARDVVAIVKALGFRKASIFGTSSGGLIALQLAASYPEYLDHVVIHEVPTLSLLVGEPNDRMDEAYVVYETFREKGAEAALQVFRASGAGTLSPDLKHTCSDSPITARVVPVSPHRLDYFFEYEFIVFHTYTPPFAQVKANGVSVAVVEGKESGNKFYARVTKIQAELMGCEHMVWPGGHALFVAQPEEFATSLRDTLVMLDGLK